MSIVHWSDCSVYNAPAFEPGPCDCGAAKAHKKWWSYAYHLFGIQVSALKMRIRTRLEILFPKLLSFSNQAPYQNQRFHEFDNIEAPHWNPDLNHKRAAQQFEDDRDN